jgi:hypothetical protein
MTPLVPAVDLRPYGIDLHSGDTFAAHVTYDGATLAITLTDLTHAASYTGSYTINIPAVIGSPQAYVGFTGGTGWQGAVQDILSFSFSSN